MDTTDSGRSLGSALVFAVILLAHNPAVAQQTVDAGSVAQDIVVTAQKREERLQDVPIAVSAFDDAALQRFGIQNAEALTALIPNLQFGTTDVNARIAIRGIGTGDTNFAADPGIAFHVDGVYQARASGAATAPLFDLERVEVLRGPQGTLYGRNATGGAVNVISRKPQPEHEHYAELLFGSFERVRLRGFTNLPVSDSVFVRLTGEYDLANGWTENLVGRNLNDRNALFLRGQVRFVPAAGHDLILRGLYSRRVGVGPSPVVIEPLDNRPGHPIIGGGGTAAQVQGSSRNLALRYAGALPNVSLENPFQTRQETRNSVDTKTWGANAEYTADLGPVALRAIAAYQKGEEFFFEDSDRTELFIADRSNDRSYTQKSIEATISSNHGGPLRWIIGAFWMSDTVDQYLLFRNSLASTAIPLIRDDSFDGNTLAGFGQASLAVAEGLTVTAGARYTRDRKSGAQFGQDFNGQIRLADERGEWREPTWRFAVDWKPGADHLLFASYSRGYKAGGFRFLPTVGGVDPDGSYRPEFVNALEIGSKSSFFDRRLIFNATAFNYDYTDLQFVEIRDQQQIVSNIGEARIRGLELELNGRPAEGLNLFATLAYLDAEILEFSGADPRFGALNPANPDLSNPANINPGQGFPVDTAGNRLPQAPRWSLNLSAQYDIEIGGDHVITPMARVSWQDETYFTPFNSPVERQKPYARVDLQLAWRGDRDRISAEIFVNNVGNVAARTFVFNSSATTGTLYQATYAAPRTFGMRFGRKF